MSVAQKTGLAAVVMLCIAGVSVAAFVHVNALHGRLPFGDATMALQFYAVVAMIAAVVATTSSKRDELFSRRARGLRSAPLSVLVVAYGLLGYFVVTFVAFAVEHPDARLHPPPFVDVVRVFSSGWMAMLALGAGMVWSKIGIVSGPRCPNGHVIDEGDQYCGWCGAGIERS